MREFIPRGFWVRHLRFPARQCILTGTPDEVVMEPDRKRLRRQEFGTGPDRVTLTLDREDYSAVYPGMVRFILAVTSGGEARAIFRTNTYEYSPLIPLAAETSAVRRADALEAQLRKDPAGTLRDLAERKPETPTPEPAGTALPQADIVIIQGSPRPDGNCAILAAWVADAAHAAGSTVRVIWPHDMDIHHCIGCYQCYNTGTCVFEDDMREIIAAIRGASVLAICSPVYTNTVPGPLKLLIDRMQEYHAERLLKQKRTGQKGIILAVAGRRGEDNFACVTSVLAAFLENIGIRPADRILVDRTDSLKDIRTLPGLEERVKETVTRMLAPG
jgi:multimeric flavodoxin WrbA